MGFFLPGGGSGGANLHIGDVGDVSIHWEECGRISLPGDMPTDREAAKTSDRRELVLPQTGYGDGRLRIVGGGDICFPLP